MGQTKAWLPRIGLGVLLMAMAVASFFDWWMWAANPPAVRASDLSWLARTFYGTPWIFLAYKVLVVLGVATVCAVVAHAIGRACGTAERLVTIGAYLAVAAVVVGMTYQYYIGAMNNIAAATWPTYICTPA